MGKIALKGKDRIPSIHSQVLCKVSFGESKKYSCIISLFPPFCPKTKHDQHLPPARSHRLPERVSHLASGENDDWRPTLHPWVDVFYPFQGAFLRFHVRFFQETTPTHMLKNYLQHLQGVFC